MSPSPKLLALAKLLTDQHWWMATAESCTGGMVASQLTSLPGASRWFDHSIVSYSYAAKQRLLSVRDATLATDGAVSALCVEEMVKGLLVSPVDAGLAVSGIAGPDGGTLDKPVGTVWFAVAKKGRLLESTMVQFNADRDGIRRQASAFAIDYFYDYLCRVSTEEPVC